MGAVAVGGTAEEGRVGAGAGQAGRCCFLLCGATA